MGERHGTCWQCGSYAENDDSFLAKIGDLRVDRTWTQVRQHPYMDGGHRRTATDNKDKVSIAIYVST